MSNNRYRRLKDLEFGSYILDCPVQVEKGALLFDHELKTVLLQMRIVNVGSKVVSSVYIHVDCYDDAGDPISGVNMVEHAYLDIHAGPKSSFGDKNPVALDWRVRKVRVSIGKVTLQDGEVWRNREKVEFTSPKQDSLRELGTELLSQFHRETNPLAPARREKAKYIPKQLDGMWLCSCGRANPDDVKTCCLCGMEKIWIFKNTERGYLSAQLKEYHEEIRIAEEQGRIMAEASEKERIEKERVSHEIHAIENAKRIRRYRRNGILAALSLLIMISAWKLFFEPYDSYVKGITLYNKGDYAAAVKMFEPIRSFKNTESWIENAKHAQEYVQALTFIKSKNYDKAIKILENHEGDNDSIELLRKTKYDYAVSLYKNRQFNKARELFRSVSGFYNVTKYLNTP